MHEFNKHRSSHLHSCVVITLQRNIHIDLQAQCSCMFSIIRQSITTIILVWLPILLQGFIQQQFFFIKPCYGTAIILCPTQCTIVLHQDLCHAPISKGNPDGLSSFCQPLAPLRVFSTNACFFSFKSR